MDTIAPAGTTLLRGCLRGSRRTCQDARSHGRGAISKGRTIRRREELGSFQITHSPRSVLVTSHDEHAALVGSRCSQPHTVKTASFEKDLDVTQPFREDAFSPPVTNV